MPVVQSSGLVVTSSADNPIIGWDDIVASTNVAATTSQTLYPVSNLGNPSTHLPWKGSINTGDEYLTVTTGVSTPIDYLAIAAHNMGSGGFTVSVEDPTHSPVVVLAGPVAPTDDAPIIFQFEPQVLSSVRLRIQQGADNYPQVAVLYVGKLLILERSIKVDTDHTPFNLYQSGKIVNGKSESGHFLGRIVLNRQASSTADFSNFNPDWYRANMQPVVEGSQEDPFFFAWNPREYPNECGYAWVVEDPKPEVNPVTRRVALQLKMEGLIV